MREIKELIDDILLTTNTKFICCVECEKYLDASKNDNINIKRVIDHYNNKHSDLIPKKLNVIDFYNKK